jgi:IS605 OrfB family transposase
MKTYNIQLIFEKDEDKQSLINSLSLKRDAFNVISKIRFGMKTCNGIMPLHQRSYKLIRNQFPTLPSQFVIKAEQDVISKYKTLRSNFHKITEPVSTDRLNIQLDTRIYGWSNDEHTSIKLTTCDGRITAKLSKYDKVNELFDKYELKDPSLFVRDNNVFLSVVFDDTIPFKDNKKCIGVDLGLKRLASTSEGIIIKGNEFNKHKRKIRWNKRKLQSHKSHSARVKKTNLRRREYHFSKNYIHNVVNNILTTKANTIVIEDLSKIKSKSKGRRFNNRNSQMPYFLLRNILTYKASALGKRVVIVKPHYTSQLDHRGLDNGVRKGCRYYGLDKVVLDADLNAANNITFRYDKEHSVSCKALDGQVVVNQPIVSFSKRQAPTALASV